MKYEGLFFALALASATEILTGASNSVIPALCGETQDMYVMYDVRWCTLLTVFSVCRLEDSICGQMEADCLQRDYSSPEILNCTF